MCLWNGIKTFIISFDCFRLWICLFICKRLWFPIFFDLFFFSCFFFLCILPMKMVMRWKRDHAFEKAYFLYVRSIHFHFVSFHSFWFVGFSFLYFSFQLFFFQLRNCVSKIHQIQTKWNFSVPFKIIIKAKKKREFLTRFKVMCVCATKCQHPRQKRGINIFQLSLLLIAKDMCTIEISLHVIRPIGNRNYFMP